MKEALKRLTAMPDATLRVRARRAARGARRGAAGERAGGRRAVGAAGAAARGLERADRAAARRARRVQDRQHRLRRRRVARAHVQLQHVGECFERRLELVGVGRLREEPHAVRAVGGGVWTAQAGADGDLVGARVRPRR
jgi:hypothetical protein